MMLRLEGCYDGVVEVSLREVAPDDLDRAAAQVPRRRPRDRAAGDHHARTGSGAPGDTPINQLYEEHLVRDARARRARQGAARRARRRQLVDQGRRDAGGRHELGRLLRRPSRHGWASSPRSRSRSSTSRSAATSSSSVSHSVRAIPQTVTVAERILEQERTAASRIRGHVRRGRHRRARSSGSGVGTQVA